MAVHTSPKPWQKYREDRWEPEGECSHKVIVMKVDGFLRRLFGLQPYLVISRCTECGEKLPQPPRDILTKS